MRRVPLRGEKLSLKTGEEVVVLEPQGKEFVKVIMPNGKIEAVPKNLFFLEVINTKYYEKVVNA